MWFDDYFILLVAAVISSVLLALGSIYPWSER